MLQRRRVGIERASAYGELASIVAENAQTGTSIDNTVAGQLGAATGASASLGVTFTELSGFIDDPTAFVEGVGAMAELVKEEEAGAFETIVEVYAKQLERKQDQNNPYEVDTTEHISFKGSWYTGYSAGFLMKEILGSKGAGAAKSTLTRVNSVENAVSRLRNTGAITALGRISSAAEAAPGKAVARIARKFGDDAAEPVLSQGDTAGQVVQLWRLQRKMDAVVSDLPESRQADIGRYLKRTGSDGRDTYNAVAEVDSDAAQTLVKIENPAVQRQFVQTYTATAVEGDAVARALNRRDSLTADGRNELDGILRRNGNDGVEFATESDSETFDAVVWPCRATGVLSVGGAGRLQASRLYAVEQPTQAVVQSDDCVNLPDDVDDNLDDALTRSDRDFDDETVRNLKPSISDLDRDAQDSAIELVEAADGDGVRFINDHDSDALRKVLGEDDVGTPALQGTARRYGDIDADIVQLRSREAIPDDWVLTEKPLEELL